MSLPPEPPSGPATDLPVIRTARTLDAIQRAVTRGLRPLLRAVAPSPEVRNHHNGVFQHPATHDVFVWYDFRMPPPEGYREVLPPAEYYPYTFPEPYAAYLIPPHLPPGTRVRLADVIEDLVGDRHSQGPTYRVEQCEATWTGTDLTLHADDLPDGDYTMIG